VKKKFFYGIAFYKSFAAVDVSPSTAAKKILS
jgi:hypothetical protein